MGQSPSKVASRAAQKASRNIPASNVSASAAAAEASQRVRPPSYTTPPSAKDLEQRKFLLQQQQKGGLPGKVADAQDIELPADLVDFLKDAGPVKAPKQTKGAKSSPSSQSTTPSAPRSDRQQTSMPLVQNIPGYDTTKTTNFSHVAPPTLPPHVYQQGSTIDLYRLVQQKSVLYTSEQQQSNLSIPEATLQKIVDQTYQTYSQTHTLPSADVQQEHKQLLRHALKYLDVPTILEDTSPYADDSYSGVPPSQAAEYQQFQYKVVSKTRVKLVLEDLEELERKEQDGPCQ